MAKHISSGVLVTDGQRVLLGHATGSKRWDIPKGLAEPDENLRAAAVRELREETGLIVDPAALEDLGVHRYLPAKDLALFRWRVTDIPDIATLSCASTFVDKGGLVRPEFDRFVTVSIISAPSLVGKSLAALLGRLGCLTRDAS